MNHKLNRILVWITIVIYIPCIILLLYYWFTFYCPKIQDFISSLPEEEYVIVTNTIYTLILLGVITLLSREL